MKRKVKTPTWTEMPNGSLRSNMTTGELNRWQKQTGLDAKLHGKYIRKKGGLF